MADRRIKDRNGKDGETDKNKIVGQNVKLVTFTATQSLRRLQMWSDKAGSIVRVRRNVRFAIGLRHTGKVR
jgi:hypothetical protein